MLRVRRSLQEVEADYISGKDRATLEKLIRAFVGIQSRAHDDPDSFFAIGGYHGEPFRDPPLGLPVEKTWWGGYCNHDNVLFPTWHRAYLLRFENALRSVKGCEDVTLPFWDECLSPNSRVPIPAILTSPTFALDGETIPNPLYSYTLPVDLVDNYSRSVGSEPQPNHRYSKPKGYETVRFPLSGLVGTEEDLENTKIWNAQFKDVATRNEMLNGNIFNWMNARITIENPHDGTSIPDTSSVLSRFRMCLNAPNYTVFSNKASMGEHVEANAGPQTPRTPQCVSLEDPHNAIHLALGGFYQPGNYIANPDQVPKANGDMSDNETTGFDPIFYFHHAFIDYVFWVWQRKHGMTEKGGITIDPESKGAKSYEGNVGIPPGVPLTMETPLRPFQKPGRTGDSDNDYLTSGDVVNIEKQLGYTYDNGSLDSQIDLIAPSELGEFILVGESEPDFVAIKKISNISRAQYHGSFVIRTSAITPSGKEVEVGVDAILSRRNIDNCQNCQQRLAVNSYVPIHRSLADALKEGAEDYSKIGYKVRIQTAACRGRDISFDRVDAPTIADLI